MKPLIRQPALLAFICTALLFAPFGFLRGDWQGGAALLVFAAMTLAMAYFEKRLWSALQLLLLALVWGADSYLLFTAWFENLGVMGVVAGFMGFLNLVMALTQKFKPDALIDT